MAKFEWKFHHRLKDGTELKPGEHIPHTPATEAVILRAMEVCEKQLSRLRGQAGDDVVPEH